MKVLLSLIVITLSLTACSSSTPPQKFSIDERAKVMTKEPSQFAKRRYTNYVNAKKHEAEGNYKQAFKLYMEAASENYGDAINEVGRLYYEGKGVEKDYTKAAIWMERGVNSHYHRVSLYNLAQLYLKGEGVNKDYSKALKYYSVSAKMYDENAAKYGLRGYAPAQNNLAYMYENGLGTPKNITKAKALYSTAAKQGYELSIKNLKRIKDSGQ